MRRVGRRRTKDLQLPEGVRPIGASLFWQPTTQRERDERAKAKLPGSVPLGKIVRARGRIELTLEQRKRWAVITGRAAQAQEGTVGELLDVWQVEAIRTRPNGRARSDSTVEQYEELLPALKTKFGAARYARNEVEASLGKGLGTPPLQDFVTAAGSLGRKYLAVLKNSFDYGIRRGRTTFNPCDKVVPLAINARTRAPQEWEIEALCTLATPVVACILAYKNLAGYRISEILRVHRRDLTADGVRHQVKGGRWETCEWSPGTRDVVAAAEALPNATRFPASPLFPNTRGRAYTPGGFYTAWVTLLERTNADLATGVLDPDSLELHAGLAIEDIVTHDIRSKVHDDAAAKAGAAAIGDTEQVAGKHYARREKRRRPQR
jgi:hypothetical protein